MGKAVPLAPDYQSKGACSGQRGVECHRTATTLGVDESEDTQEEIVSLDSTSNKKWKFGVVNKYLGPMCPVFW
jgi:hypothetical protein